MTLIRPIAEIEAELAAAKQAEIDLAEATKQATKPVFRYTILPVTEERTYDRVFDDTCKFYTLSGDCINTEAAHAAGWSSMDTRGGAMKYLFNTGTNKLVCAVGGGTIFISNGFGLRPNEVDYEAHAYEQISRYLSICPEGGDITEIVFEHRTSRGLKS